MSSPISIRVNTTEFDRVLRRYIELNKRDLPDIVNRKAYEIAKVACALTHRTGKGQVARELGVRLRRVREMNPLTNRLHRVRRAYAATAGEAPLAALIINARRGSKGQPGLYGRAMERAIYRLTVIRDQSRAFIASGWVPAIATLGTLVGLQFRGAKKIGRAKGSAVPARPGSYKVMARITNAASAKRDHKEALILYGEPALQSAFHQETRSMKDYIARKLGDSARSLGIKTG
ncbi:MAG: hypothetical protein PHQ12_12880 [Chthoniobacteraceae bacterium]|nr:hypothetical protein [Chthoniobacteraceae bacterium]